MKKKKNKKQRSRVAHWLEYAFLRFMAFLCSGMRDRARVRIARGFGWVAYRCFPFLHGRVRENLAIAFPDWPPEKREALIPGVYENLAALGMETLSVGRIDPASLLSRIQQPVEGIEHLEAAKQAGKGCVVICGHIGSWEWGWLYLLQQGYDVMAVTKHLHNPLVDDYVWNLRRSLGLKPQFISDNLKGMIKHLRAGGVLGIMPDQDARKQGIFIPFFGRPASTATGPAWMAYHLGVPLIHAYALRIGEGKLRIQFDAPIWADKSAPQEAEIERVTRQHVALLERAILQDPAQYLWFHRRWKTQPKPSAEVREPIGAAPETLET